MKSCVPALAGLWLKKAVVPACSGQAQTGIDMKCRVCGNQVDLSISCVAVTVRCISCGTTYPVAEYAEELDDALWERIESRPCNRV